MGRAIFFDEDLSINRDQSCAACHGENGGSRGPRFGDQCSRRGSTRARSRGDSVIASPRPPPVFAVNCWPAPEVGQNMNRDELGNLGLNEAEEEAIVAFLKTLSDGYVPR
ncbi:MAG: c-type cytochrome [Longimicrobiales bacterium]